MILTTHATVAAALTMHSPILGLASHYVIDAIPHRDYSLSYLDELSVEDYGKITLDALLGFCLAFTIGWIHGSVPLGILGFCLGVFPDFLQFIHSRLAHPLIELHQRFHHWCHTQRDVNLMVGVLIQVILVIICLRY